jgi:hypothetical protein
MEVESKPAETIRKKRAIFQQNGSMEIHTARIVEEI